MQHHRIEISGRAIEVHATSAAPRICAAHTSESFGGQTAELLAETAGIDAACITLPPGAALEQIVDDVEAVRRELGLPPWIFWGMSGGGWLALLYAHRQRAGLSAIIVESACACFRARLGDPACALSPMFPAWCARLEAAGRIDPRAHDQPSDQTSATWETIGGLGEVWCRTDGAALLVAPMPLEPVMKAGMPRLWSFDARPWIAGLEIPALVIAGAIDPIVPVHRVRAVHEAIAGSRWLVADGGSHVPTAARHPAIAPAVRGFL